MDSAQLQYDGLRTVLQYLDPNLRFKLVKHIPSLQSVEKAVPLKIKELKFQRNRSLKVDETEYQFGVYRYYPGSTPEIHWGWNSIGGNWADIDQWGFDEPCIRKAISPGDVVLPQANKIDVERLDNNQVYYERYVEILQRAIEERLKKGEELDEIPEIGPLPKGMENGISLDAYANRVFENPEEKGRQYRHLLGLIEKYISIGCLQYNLQRNQEHLKPYYCRRDNTPPAFIPQLHLTITSPGKKEVHRFRYTMKLHEAMKALCTQFFGARRCAINVGTFDILNCWVLSLPVDVKFRTQKLMGGSAADKLEVVEEE